jgi:hypothetical protein
VSHPSFLHFSPFWVLFSQNTLFSVSFQKIDPQLGAITIDTELQRVSAYVRVDVYVDLTWQYLGAEVGAMDFGVDLRVYKYPIPVVGFSIFG